MRCRLATSRQPMPASNKPHIGIISPRWLPYFGGAEQYEHNLAVALLEQGFAVSVFTGSEAKPDRDNGQLTVIRHTPNGDYVPANWRAIHRGDDRAAQNLSNSYDFLDAALRWANQSELDIAILGNSLNTP